METRFVCIDAVVHVIADEQIEPPVPIVIDERRRDAPPEIFRSTRFRDVSKSSVAVITEQLAAFEISHEEVDASVVGDVTGRSAHRVPVNLEPAGICDIGESQRARTVGVNLEIIPVQAALERNLRRVEGFAERLLSEHLSLRHEYIEVAVVVVVEQGDAGRYDFWEMKRTSHSVEVD